MKKCYTFFLNKPYIIFFLRIIYTHQYARIGKKMVIGKSLIEQKYICNDLYIMIDDLHEPYI